MFSIKKLFPGLGKLGRDFWLFRIGQFVSVLGNSCTIYAISWWLLDKTGSSVFTSSVLAIGTVAQIIVNGLCAPLGDRLERKKIMLIGYAVSGIAISGFALMAGLNLFHPGIIITLYIFASIGSSIFNIGAIGVIVKLVPQQQYHEAVRIWQTMGALGMILGGALAGVAISAINVTGAFSIDALTFVIAFLFVQAILANTKPLRLNKHSASFMKTWSLDLVEGLLTFKKMKFLFFVLLIFCSMNILIAPMPFIIPYYVKQVSNLPAWYMAFLDVGFAVGTILGAFLLGRVPGFWRRDIVAYGGLFLLAFGFMIFALGGIVSPTAGLLLSGTGLTIFNIQVNSTLMLAIPDHLRVRIFSLISLVSESTRPLGLFFSGYLFKTISVGLFCSACGIAFIFLTILLMLFKEWNVFLRLTPAQANGHFERKYKILTPVSEEMDCTPKP